MKKHLASLITVTFLTTGIGAPLVQAEEVNNKTVQNLKEDKAFSTILDNASEKEITDLFVAIENIPDEVLAQGDVATNQWLAKELYGNQSDNYDPNSEDPFIIQKGTIGCVSAIGIAIASNVFSAAKIAKVKDVLKAAGGARTFVTKLLPAYKYARETKKLGKMDSVKYAVKKAASKASPEVLAAAIGFFSVGEVYSACFE